MAGALLEVTVPESGFNHFAGTSLRELPFLRQVPEWIAGGYLRAVDDESWWPAWATSITYNHEIELRLTTLWHQLAQVGSSSSDSGRYQLQSSAALERQWGEQEEELAEEQSHFRPGLRAHQVRLSLSTS